ncbi:uncharacterized protein LOC135218903 [Macrobrachium nipponense]|uniref:uncharacterized protein LOC135218903 n=1 Tax=Macrobrachium nipponense TaxID=159736 RepID=UPI0030C818D1
MPYHYVVPNCKGNYETGPKVNIFSFPKNEELAVKWIPAIKRESFTPTTYSKVCSLYFMPEVIIWEKSCYDKNTGTTSTTKLKMPQLREGGHYNISVRQVFECEKKLRMMSVLKQKLSFNDRAVHVAINDEINWNDLETTHTVKGTLRDISLQVTE